MSDMTPTLLLLLAAAVIGSSIGIVIPLLCAVARKIVRKAGRDE
jgi:predicted membrane-bound spermidine synthase